MAVKGARSLRVHRSEAQTLDGHRSGGYARERAGTPVSASILCFQHVDAAATAGYSRSNREPPGLPSTALSSTGSRPGNLQQLRSNRAGVTCPPTSDAVGAVTCSGEEGRLFRSILLLRTRKFVGFRFLFIANDFLHVVLE